MKPDDIHNCPDAGLSQMLKSLGKALQAGRISSEFHAQQVQSITAEINTRLWRKGAASVGAVPPKMRNGHVILELSCSCGWKGIVTCGEMDARLLGKDPKGFIYFECAQCKRHLRYDPIQGKTATRKGVLGFLFGHFS